MDVCALGELLIDFTCTGADSKGYPAMQAHPGGAPANFLAALSAFGAETALIGSVGRDAFGKMLCGSLEKAGISTEGISISDAAFTTLAFVTLDEKGQREFSFARKPGADTCLRLEESGRRLIKDCRLFHFGSLSLTDEPARTATAEAIKLAKSCGKLISYDPNYRPPLWKSEAEAKEQMLWGLSQADIIKISDNELEFLFGMGPEDGGKYILSRFSPKLLFVSCGEKGSFYVNKNAGGFVPALKNLKVSDTTGAGDIFFGAAMWKVLNSGRNAETLSGAELEEISLFANTAAGLSTERPGGISSVPGLREVMAKMNK